MHIIPAVYPEAFEEVADKLYLLSGLTSFAQIVLCDGSYGLRKSWLPTGREILPSTFDYQFDCILTSWREYLAKAYQMGVKNIIIHIDEFSNEDFDELFKMVRVYDISLGFAVSNDISVDVLINAVLKAEEVKLFEDTNRVFIQVTGMRNLEENKHPFDERVLNRIRVLKKLLPSHSIQVGGRINPDTARLVRQAGADRLVVGSYLFGHEDMKEALGNLIIAITEELQEKSEQLEQSVAIKEEPVAIKEEPPQPAEEKEEVPPPLEETKKEKEKREKYEASKHEIIYDLDEDEFAPH